LFLPKPIPGLVIPYAYLWWHEYNNGAEDGRKVRPCVVVLSVEEKDGTTKVTVAPITHRSPDKAKSTALEIPQMVKNYLKLDDERSWIIVDEVNQFIWPGPDVWPVSKNPQNPKAYGVLPPKLFGILKKMLLDVVQRKKIKFVKRTP
jgi:hypothetical protein